MLAILKARLKDLVGEIKALTDKADMTAEDFAGLETKTAEVEEIEKKIDALTKAEALQARAALPADTPLPSATAPAQVKKDLTTVEKVGVMVFSMAKAQKIHKIATPTLTFQMMKDAGYEAIAREFSFATERALNSGSASAGGVLLPDEMSSDIIDILRPTTTFLRGGPSRISLARGAYHLPAAASGATANWRGEGQAIQLSQPTFKDINLVAKFLDAMVPMTNQLIRWSLADVRGWVERDMANKMSVALDYAAYFGTGGVNTPLGITLVPGITRNAATGGTSPTVAQIESDARIAELSMEGRNLLMTNAAWVMAPRTVAYLADLRGSGTDHKIFPDMSGANPMWRGRPVLKTTQVSITGGATTDESEILLVNFDDVLFGESAGMSFDVTTQGAYVNASGATVSAFQNDLTVIKCSMEADVGLRYLEAVAVIESVRWGA